jgi:hypothetical protein
MVVPECPRAIFHIFFIFPSSFLHNFILFLKVENKFSHFLGQPVTLQLAATLQSKSVSYRERQPHFIHPWGRDCKAPQASMFSSWVNSSGQYSLLIWQIDRDMCQPFHLITIKTIDFLPGIPFAQ